MRVHTVVIALVLGTMAFAPMAQAETGRRIAVAYGDLDLARADDARVLAERIDEAARFACGGNPRFDPNYRNAQTAATRRFEACRSEAVDAALADLNAPTVERAFAQLEGAQLPAHSR